MDAATLETALDDYFAPWVQSLAFGEIDLRGATDGKSVCRAGTTYALL